MPKFVWIRGKKNIFDWVKNSRGEKIGQITRLCRNQDGELTALDIDDVSYVRVEGKKTCFQMWSSIGDKS